MKENEKANEAVRSWRQP